MIARYNLDGSGYTILAEENMESGPDGVALDWTNGSLLNPTSDKHFVIVADL